MVEKKVRVDGSEIVVRCRLRLRTSLGHNKYLLYPTTSSKQLISTYMRNTSVFATEKFVDNSS